MPGKISFSKNDLIELIESTEVAGTDATDLKNLLAEVEQGKQEKRSEKSVNQVTNEDYIAELRSKSPVEHGTDLECMICHEKFDTLISGTCEGCFSKWALATKKTD